MKVVNLPVAFFLLATIVSSCSPKKTKLQTIDIASRIDSLLRTVPDFSGVILVADKGEVLYKKASGFRDIDRRIPLDTADIFELASLSKQFTAMIIMMLEEQGKLNYDDSLSKFLPQLPYRGITIRHLLNHTSGLPDYQRVMDQYWDKSMVAGNEENIEYLTRYHPPAEFQAGEKYRYSNTGYMLLATIAEKVSGEDFTVLCREWIFAPLGLTSTDIRTRQQKSTIKNFALGYIYVQEKERYVSADSFPEFNYAIWLGNRKGPGRISSTASDLLKWDRALYSEKLVKQSTLKKAFTPAKLTGGSVSYYGFGWEISNDEGLGNVVRHTGDNPGYKTEIIRYPDADRTIILLNNNAHERKAEIVSNIRNIVAAGFN